MSDHARRGYYVLACSAFVALLCGGLCAHAQENGVISQTRNPYAGNPEAIAEGQALYKELNCYGCHGMRGGGGMGPNLTDNVWQTGDGSDASLLAQIRDGRGKMPAYREVITDEQAWKLIAFIRTLYKGDPSKVAW